MELAEQVADVGVQQQPGTVCREGCEVQDQRILEQSSGRRLREAVGTLTPLTRPLKVIHHPDPRVVVLVNAEATASLRKSVTVFT